MSRVVRAERRGSGEVEMACGREDIIRMVL